MGASAFAKTAGSDRNVAEFSDAARKILLVEDDPLVAEACEMLLEDFGYAVKRAATADEALQLVTAGEQVDLVFSDIVMPGELTGVELAQILRDKWPKLPILLTSGFSKAAADALKRGFSLLPKPYLPTDLQREIESALAAAPSNRKASQ
jgi:CheY-like chemotaxis protein